MTSSIVTFPTLGWEQNGDTSVAMIKTSMEINFSRKLVTYVDADMTFSMVRIGSSGLRLLLDGVKNFGKILCFVEEYRGICIDRGQCHGRNASQDRDIDK
jgi:acyl-CoA thioesterase FadM